MENVKRTKMIKMLSVLTVFALLFIFVGGNVMGIDVKNPDDVVTGGAASAQVSTVAGAIWKTFVMIVQIAAVAAIVIAGIRYMFASAEQKADIKKETVILVVGAVLVFAAVPLADVIAKAANEILK